MFDTDASRRTLAAKAERIALDLDAAASEVRTLADRLNDVTTGVEIHDVVADILAVAVTATQREHVRNLVNAAEDHARTYRNAARQAEAQA